MTFNYSADPSSSDLDEVRFWLQDTDSTDPLLQDEELQFLLDTWDHIADSNLFTAAVAAEIIAARFAREVNISADGVSANVSELQQKYNDLAASLRDQYKQKGATGAPFAGGTTHWESMASLQSDPSIKPLWAWLGMHDNPEAGPQDADSLRGLPWWWPYPEDAIK